MRIKLILRLTFLALFLITAGCGQNTKKTGYPPAPLSIDSYFSILDQDSTLRTEFTEKEMKQIEKKDMITSFSDRNARELTGKYYIAAANILIHAKKEKDLRRLGRYAGSANVLLQYAVILGLYRSIDYFETNGFAGKYNTSYKFGKYYHEIIPYLAGVYQSSPDAGIRHCAAKVLEKSRALEIPEHRDW